VEYDAAPCCQGHRGGDLRSDVRGAGGARRDRRGQDDGSAPVHVLGGALRLRAPFAPEPLSTRAQVCPPEQDGGGGGGAGGGGGGGAAGAGSGEGATAAAPRKRKAASAKEPKLWEPKYKTANFALLVTLDRLKREGQATVSKATLVEAAERSQLSADGIKPRGASTSAAAAAGAHGKQYTYDGWSGFKTYLSSLLPVRSLRSVLQRIELELS